MAKKNNTKNTKSRKDLRRQRDMRKTRSRMSRDDMQQAIVAILQSNPRTLVNYKQLGHALEISAMPQKMMISGILNDLKDSNVVEEVEPGRFRFRSDSLYVTGYFVRRANGFTCVNPEDGSEAIYIDEYSTAHALNADKVRVQLRPMRQQQRLRHSGKARLREGFVVEILERNKQNYVGEIVMSGSMARLVTYDKALPEDILIPLDKLNNAREGEKVIVRINSWPENAKKPLGEVLAVLGKKGDMDTEMHAILAEFGLPYTYPKEVEEAADKLSGEISKADEAEREDFRSVLTFTIDPVDAKDFDDALSFRVISDGLYEVGVHIADVSHFVNEGDIIDKEAFDRATSVYLVDRTIPMLPERLCNELCSLRPDEDKFGYSCVFEVDDEAQVKDYRIVRTLIRSDRRFSYEEAQQVIETGEGDCSEAILKLNDLAQKMRQARFDNGAIAFERKEVRFELDEKGKPIGLIVRESKEAHKLIEEWMLMANRTVAKHIGEPQEGKKTRTFVYRIHDLPDQEKLENLSNFIRPMGYSLRATGSQLELSASINKLMSSIHNKPEENLIATVAIRAMSKAIYSTSNIGHYGLAFPFYSHFTSPIRRYPDLMAHRLLTRYLIEKKPSVDADEYEEKCRHASDMEQLAATAERESIKYKQVEFMQDHLGKVFDGVITSVTDWGIYVELKENMCEGMVPLHTMDDDYYEFDEKSYSIVGRRTHKRYQLGDAVSVRVAQANLERKILDFEML